MSPMNKGDFVIGVHISLVVLDTHITDMQSVFHLQTVENMLCTVTFSCFSSNWTHGLKALWSSLSLVFYLSLKSQIFFICLRDLSVCGFWYLWGGFWNQSFLNTGELYFSPLSLKFLIVRWGYRGISLELWVTGYRACSYLP